MCSQQARFALGIDRQVGECVALYSIVFANTSVPYICLGVDRSATDTRIHGMGMQSIPTINVCQPFRRYMLRLAVISALQFDKTLLYIKLSLQREWKIQTHNYPN